MTGTPRPMVVARSRWSSGWVGGDRDGVERAAVPARVGALRGEDVDAACDRHLALGERGHGRDGGDTEFPEAGALRGLGQPERERHHLRTQVHHHLELRGPMVILVTRVPELGVVPARLLLEGRRVPVDRVADRHAGLRYEQVHPQRAGCQVARCGDALGQHLGRQIASGQEAEASRIGCRRGQFGRAGPACHRGGDHGDFQ